MKTNIFWTTKCPTAKNLATVCTFGRKIWPRYVPSGVRDCTPAKVAQNPPLHLKALIKYNVSKYNALAKYNSLIKHKALIQNNVVKYNALAKYNVSIVYMAI